MSSDVASDPDVTSEPSGDDSDLLRAYRREKLELADVLLSIMHLAEARRDEARTAQIRALAGRLAEDRFQLAVVGQFSRGKSTLMNAILGDAYLPTGALPMTSVVTTVVYGSTARATIRRRGGLLPIDVPLARLPRYVAQASAEREELRVASALIELPAEILRLGFSFVDTPGVGSAIVANTGTTLDFLPEADAVIFVTSFDSPLTEAEVLFLRRVRDEVKRIFVVLNKRDLVTDDEAEQVQSFVAKRLAEAGVQAPSVFALSARDGLAAKGAGDAARFRRSGLARLEAELTEYLTSEKAAEFLLRVGERATRFIEVFESEVGIAERFEKDEAARSHLDDLLTTASERYDGRRRDVLASIGASSASAGDELASADSRPWKETLGDLVLDALGDGAPRHAVRPRSEGPELEEKSRETVARWSEKTAASWLAAFENGHLDQLRELDRIPVDFESEIARAVGAVAVTDLPEDDHRPRLVVGSVPWTFAGVDGSHVVTGRQRVTGRRGASGWRGAIHLDDAVAGAVEHHVECLVERLRSATTRWLTELDRWSAEALDATSARVRTRLVSRPEATVRDELATLRRTLGESRRRVGSWGLDRPHASPPAAPPPSAEPVERGTGCLICERLVKALFEFMAHYQFALATRIERRIAHAAGGGFCAAHTWYYAEIGSPVGVSASYARLGEHVASLLREAALAATDTADLGKALRSSRADAATCPACRRLAEVRLKVLDETRRSLGGGELVPPLCLDHAAGLVAGLDLRLARQVVLSSANRLARRAEDMRTYSLKREALRRELIDEEETDAYRDLLVRLVSDPLVAAAGGRRSPPSRPLSYAARRSGATPTAG